jgi:hypothetical protein
MLLKNSLVRLWASTGRIGLLGGLTIASGMLPLSKTTLREFFNSIGQTEPLGMA